MRRIILGIIFVVLASDSIKVYCQRMYRNEYANLTQVPIDIPDEATFVFLRYNMITDIPISAFSHLRDCHTLRLSRNQLSVIESGMFNGLNSLTYLYLSHNKITTVGENSFSGLTSLTTLDLATNKITIISDKTFSSLQACKNLYLQNNRISTIPEGTFTRLNSSATISLDGNNFQTVPANVFPYNLEYLGLGSNKISALQDVDLTNLVFLKILNIRNSRISNLSANAFFTLSNCETISLHYNPIENIEVGAFHGLDKLTKLYLYRTSLTHLSPNAFQGLPSLQYLRLDQSRISQIARGAFTELDQLITLTLNTNELIVIESYMFSGLVSLRLLYLNQNNINDIRDSAFLMLGNLKSLYLHENQLKHLRLSTFAGLVSLESLDLGHNKLTTLDPLVLSPLKRPLELAMEALLTPSSMVCDIKLCWLKLEEGAGNIIWTFRQEYINFRLATDIYYPTCTGGDWRLLQCPATISCRDPGDVVFAERSGSFLPFNNNSQPGLGLPYSTDSELRYTCDPCYTGGGTITCQSNGQWTRKPECVRLDIKVICSAPALANGYLTPSFNQYECGVKVTFTCDEGFILSGPPDGTCGPDEQFVGEIPSCVKNRETVTATEGNGTETATSSPTTGSPTIGSLTTDSPITGSPGQGTKPKSGGTQGGSSGLIYGIVGAVVGGMVLMALIGLTIFCVKRSKKKNPSDADIAKSQDTVTDGGEIGIVTQGNTYTGLVTGDRNGASEAGYIEPTADRGTSHQRVTGNGTVYSNTAYEDEYQEIKDALPNNNPYEVVNDDAYEN